MLTIHTHINRGPSTQHTQAHNGGHSPNSFLCRSCDCTCIVLDPQRQGWYLKYREYEIDEKSESAEDVYGLECNGAFKIGAVRLSLAIFLLQFKDYQHF